MPRLLPISLLFAIGITFFLFSSLHAIAGPTPPQSIVFEIDSVDYTEPSGTFQANGSLLFSLSPDDPDQVNGAYQYSYYAYGSSYASGWQRFNFTDVAVSGAPGWVQHSQFSWSGPGVGSLYNLTFNMTVWAGDEEGATSCLINITDLRELGTHVECGNLIDPPSGVGLIGTRASATAGTSEGPISIPALTDVRWHLSPDDDNQTVGNFTYYLFTGAATETIANYTGMTPSWRESGVLNFTVETFTTAANQRFPFYAQLMARDNATKQRSNMSCLAFLSSGSVRESSACGTFATDLTSVADGDRHFPFANISAIATSSGLSEAGVGYVLAAMMILIGTVIGFLAGGIIIGALALLLFTVLAAVFNLYPSWMIVTFFLGALSLAVLKISGAKGGSE